MIISLSFIPGVMLGFEWVTEGGQECSDYYDDSSSTYIVLDLLIVRVLIEY